MNKIKPEVSIIIPAYNEARNIANVIKEIQLLDSAYEIIVVDDGSTDGTAEIVKPLGVRLIKHPYNIGNGAAVKTGIRNANGEILLFMDGDGQHSPKDIPKILESIGEYDMVIGTRTKHSDVSKFRAFGNYCLIKIANYLSGRKIADLTSGFRAIKKEKMLEFLHLLPNTYSYPTTITLSLLKSGYPVKYYPLHTIKKRKEGKSNISPLIDGFRFIIIITRIIMLFDPLKIFLPTSLITLFAGLILLVYNLLIFKGIQESTMMFLVVGVFIFFFGLLAEQNSQIRRELRPNSVSRIKAEE